MNAFPLPFVLDTNVARFSRVDTIEALAKRGFRLRVADTALLEWTAACVRKWEQAEWSRREARSKFFGRAKSLAPFLDPHAPIALDGGMLTRRVLADVVEAGGFREADERQQQLADLWREIIGVGMTDEEFTDAGRRANTFLDKLDRNFIALARREEELRKNEVPPDVDASLLAVGYALHDAMPEAEQLAHLRQFTVRSWNLSSAAAERFDAHICTTAYRLHVAARGARMPKENDGADVSLTLHLGAGCILLTEERRLVDIIDASGTFQAPWVRQLDDLDDLPEVPPWGERARRFASAFRRRHRSSSLPCARTPNSVTK